jgi:hypothetical protein
MVARTRTLVSRGICGLSRTTKDTVARETPQAEATSLIVTRLFALVG